MLATVLALSPALSPAAQAAEARLSIMGAEAGLEGRLSAASLTLALLGEGQARGDDLIAAAQADYGRLLGVLYERGHFGAVISIRIDGREAANLSAFDAPGRIGRIDITVEPGPVFGFSRTEIAPLPERATRPEAFRPGEPATTAAMREAVAAGIDAWRHAGHPHAEPAGQQITADHRNSAVDARFTLTPGRAATFGRLRQQGSSAVRFARIEEIAGLPTGVPYSPERLDRVAERLRRTGAFSSVRLIEGERIAEDGSLDITLELVDAPPRRIGAGIEATTDEGLTLTGFWMHRNLRGGAQRLRFDAEIAGIGGSRRGLDARLAGRYTRPGTFTADTSLSGEAELTRRQNAAFRVIALDVGATLDHVFNPRLEGSAGIRLRRFTVTGPGVGTRTGSLVALPVSLVRDGRDDRLDARQGFYGALGLKPYAVTGTRPGAGSRITLDARTYQPLGGGRVVLAARLQAGSLVGAGPGTAPPDFAFFSGGGGTVRGQPFESLGAPGSGGTRGGQSFLGAQLEARVGIGRRLGLVGFVDAGHVGARSVPGTAGDWHAGAGIGVRYDVGIGPLRLDVATPLRGGPGGVSLYLGIGQAF